MTWPSFSGASSGPDPDPVGGRPSRPRSACSPPASSRTPPVPSVSLRVVVEASRRRAQRTGGLDAPGVTEQDGCQSLMARAVTASPPSRRAGARVCRHARWDSDGLLDIGFDPTSRAGERAWTNETLRDLRDRRVRCGHAERLQGPPCEAGRGHRPYTGARRSQGGRRSAADRHPQHRGGDALGGE